ncbi:hypothetical protein ABEX25_17625 [Paenibacillus thiaminolyticus]|uniref:hypothetical protein n=1 Tax=Paenibacillus thiaminolyticus TaxID=49283 RepID=UPI003D2B3B1A
MDKMLITRHQLLDEYTIQWDRLALLRVHSGQELGKAILRWIAQGLQFPEPKKYIKLDCAGGMGSSMSITKRMAFSMQEVRMDTATNIKRNRWQALILVEADDFQMEDEHGKPYDINRISSTIA